MLMMRPKVTMVTLIRYRKAPGVKNYIMQLSLTLSRFYLQLLLFQRFWSCLPAKWIILEDQPSRAYPKSKSYDTLTESGLSTGRYRTAAVRSSLSHAKGRP